MTRLVLLLTCLVVIPCHADTRLALCSNVCQSHPTIQISSSDVDKLKQYYASAHENAAAERRAIALSHGYVETLIGKQLDEHTLDDISEFDRVYNTRAIISFLIDQQLVTRHLLWHSESASNLIYERRTAVIYSRPEHQYYAVDSNHADPGEAPPITELDEWKNGLFNRVLSAIHLKSQPEQEQPGE